jgi:hypothetical protein
MASPEEHAEDVKALIEEIKEEVSAEDFLIVLQHLREHVSILIDTAKDDARSRRGGS